MFTLVPGMGAEPCSLCQSIPGRKKNFTKLRVRGGCPCSPRVPSDPVGTDRLEPPAPNGSQPLGGWQDRACSLPPSSPSLPCHLVESTPHALTSVGLRAEEELSTPLTERPVTLSSRGRLHVGSILARCSHPCFQVECWGLGSDCVLKGPWMSVRTSCICIIFIALVG